MLGIIEFSSYLVENQTIMINTRYLLVSSLKNKRMIYYKQYRNKDGVIQRDTLKKAEFERLTKGFLEQTIAIETVHKIQLRRGA